MSLVRRFEACFQRHSDVLGAEYTLVATLNVGDHVLKGCSGTAISSVNDHDSNDGVAPFGEIDTRAMGFL